MEKNQFINQIYFRVFNVLKLWLNNGYSDFHSDTQLKSTLLDFINREMKSVGMENPANTLSKLNEKKVRQHFPSFPFFLSEKLIHQFYGKKGSSSRR